MYYTMRWYVDGSDVPSVLSAAVNALKRYGAILTEEAHYPAGLGFDFPFALRDDSILVPPYLTLWVRQRDTPPYYICVDLDCAIGVLWEGDYGRRNMQSLVTLGDAIYTSISPIFGVGNDETYNSLTLEDFLETRIPVGAQFVYVGAGLVHTVNWEALKGRRFARVSLPDGGVRVENPGPPSVPPLDLRV
ncbi:hypothetical protein [Symbiobacterium thermophilum]|uniref:hypothetical protein n=1 Tax=Symbiobacterium thermophilum TaxID=2734 RepID=UPI0011D14F89|nr:hypothetical protein [Symbiobacterium thermophilum]